EEGNSEQERLTARRPTSGADVWTASSTEASHEGATHEATRAKRAQWCVAAADQCAYEGAAYRANDCCGDLALGARARRVTGLPAHRSGRKRSPPLLTF